MLDISRMQVWGSPGDWRYHNGTGKPEVDWMCEAEPLYTAFPDLLESLEALVEALTELRKWVEWFDHSDVQNTPWKREAKCETNYEVVEIVDAALRNAGVQP